MDAHLDVTFKEPAGRERAWLMSPDLRSLRHQNQSWKALADLGLASAGIMHEVKNSLQGVASALFVLEHEPELSPRARQYVSIAQQELARVFDVSAQTLSLIRHEKPVLVCLGDVIDDVLNVYSAKIAFKEIQVERRYDFAGQIESNPVALRQIFSNLVLNALESAPRETGRLTIHAYHCLLEKGEYSGVEIEFINNGPAIPKECRQKIFEPLFSTKNGKGSGLGLWVTHRLVEKQKGRLRLLDRGEETCFSVFLPLKVA
jgi:signal transduction histidine kinase